MHSKLMHSKLMHSKLMSAQLRNVILLDNQSTLDFICNKIFTSEVNKYNTKTKVQVNGWTLLVNQSSKIPGYDQTRCLRKKAITNILPLKKTAKNLEWNTTETMKPCHAQEGSGTTKYIFPNEIIGNTSETTKTNQMNLPQPSQTQYWRTLKNLPKGNQRIKYYKTTILQDVVSIQYRLQMDDTEHSYQELWRNG